MRNAIGSARSPWRGLLAGLCLILANGTAAHCRADDGLEFFETSIRPLFVEHCYRCHSAESSELAGGLRLDLRSGWQQGGASGRAAVIPGKPDESPLIRAVRHDGDIDAMPPDRPQLSEREIANLVAWIQSGAPDPREGDAATPAATDWKSEYQRRLAWWSLQPIADSAPPAVQRGDWPRTEVDRFILARLESAGLQPAPEADRRTLVRRLSFALLGLPPRPELVERFAADESPQAFDLLVTELLANPHFGERWARHWMDVVHYADTHGYEWDVPAKCAWQYRDYLIRAFNSDLPYRELVLEQLAGDLLAPRIDPTTGLNESLIGPLMLRLGERRHGDNAASDGVSQEAVSNIIDTLGKGFLGTTLACAQCHDHKLDSVEQRDYYALAGVFMSTRFSVRSADATDPNLAVLAELRSLKRELRAALARRWLSATDPTTAGGLVEKLRATPAAQPPAAFPTSLAEFWQRALSTPPTAEEFLQERQRRVAANAGSLRLLADFAVADGAGGWRWDGQGMQHGLVANGEPVVATDGDGALLHLLPAGRFSHAWSPRLAGVLQSPPFDPTVPRTFSIEAAGGKFASQSFIVDRALHSERLQFMNLPVLGWLTLTAGKFDSLEGTPDTSYRRVYFELATKSFNNYFPPRIGYNGLSEAEVADPRSWIGATRVYEHPPGQPPQDELARFAPLFEELAGEPDWSLRLGRLVRSAVERWAREESTREDVYLLNEALQLQLLPQDLAGDPELARVVAAYRAAEQRLQPERTVGSVAEWDEGRDERLGIRGSYTDLGDAVPRGGPRFLGGPAARLPSAASGRLELARQIISADNPLTARVYVNRVWHYLFGAGLVRTPDDFGHLGEPPTHPELLDYLATRFVREGWSTKKLIRLLVTSAVWRQGSVPAPQATAIDPENRLWYCLPLRRLEAEEIRDEILFVSGRFDPSLFGPPIEPYRTAEDPQKRLLRGPLDGAGRRSIYLEMTLMEPPRFLALFNQPIPKLTVGRRDVTNVPDQALALLNDPFVLAMAEAWSQRLLGDGAATVDERAARMLAAALSRPPQAAEVERLVALVQRSAELRGISGDLLASAPLWQDAAHAIFNLKEFIYVR